jgi:16S rRNA (uracil1498-N3)-methyltransferase
MGIRLHPGRNLRKTTAMSHLHRFYVPTDTADEPGEVLLPEEEAHHAARVVRVRPGERVALVDGRGREWPGTVARVDRREVAVDASPCRRAEAPSARLTLFQAWLKRDKHIEEIVWRGTELGVWDFVFFRAAHSERPVSYDEKWLRIAQEACKQCGRLWLPSFSVAPSLPKALEGFEGRLLLASADEPPVPLREALDSGLAGLVVGPEGDFTDEERAEALKRGARCISLGSTTFRAEVAAFVGATLVLYELGQLGPRSA